MKVCMFADNDALEFQKAINNFIKDKKIIDIKYESLLLKISEERIGNQTTGKFAINNRAFILYEED